jgi:hypothetical protein
MQADRPRPCPCSWAVRGASSPSSSTPRRAGRSRACSYRSGPAAGLPVQLYARTSEGNAVVAVALAGGETGWEHRSREEDLPATAFNYEGQPARLKTRPGHHRIRFTVRGRYANSPVLFTREVEVAVPEAGVADVALRGD